jgi:hypothetical protein
MWMRVTIPDDALDDALSGDRSEAERLRQRALTLAVTGRLTG